MKKLLFLIVLLGLVSCGGEATDAGKAAANKTEKKAENIPLTKKTNTQQPQKPTINAKQSQKAQRPAPAEVKDYKAKNEGWLVDFQKAQELSSKTGKPILANFTGSDWCGWCKKLDRDVFHKPGFNEWAEKNVILLEVDFPRRFRIPTEIAQVNNSLKQAMGVRGFPSIYLFDVIDQDGKPTITPYGKTGYTKTLPEFQKTVEGFLTKRKKG